jgi:hypothetical protein
LLLLFALLLVVLTSHYFDIIMSTQGTGAPGVVGGGVDVAAAGAGLGVYGGAAPAGWTGGLPAAAGAGAGFGVFGGAPPAGWTGGLPAGAPAAPIVVEPSILQALVRLGFTQECAEKIVDVHLIETPEDLSELTDDDVVKLCGALRKPGGVDEDGDPNTGFEVSIKGQIQLQNAAAFCRVRLMCRDPGFCPNFITTSNTAPYRQFRIEDDAWEDPTTLPKINPSDWAKTFEQMYEYARLCKGLDGVLLSCVIKANDDMVYTLSSEFSSPRDEIEAKISFTAKQFKSMSLKRYDKLEEICCTHYCSTHLKPFRKNRDGCGAWFALTSTYLGGDGTCTTTRTVVAPTWKVF